jgi:hypothetical protein
MQATSEAAEAALIALPCLLLMSLPEISVSLVLAALVRLIDIKRMVSASSNIPPAHCCCNG